MANPTTSATVTPGLPTKSTGLWGLVDRYTVVILAALLLLAIPLSLDIFRLGLAAKYLSFAFCAVGIVLIWGYGGILSLG